MSQYPVLYAGQRFTAAVAASMLPLDAAKTASTSRASTTTTSADPDLQITVAASAEYVLEAYIRYSGFNGGDLKFRFTAPGTPNGSAGARTMELADTAATDASSALRLPFNADKSIGCISTTTAQVIQFRGRLITSSTAGTFSFDWAQDTSNATATIIEADSWMSLRRIA